MEEIELNTKHLQKLRGCKEGGYCVIENVDARLTDDDGLGMIHNISG